MRAENSGVSVPGSRSCAEAYVCSVGSNAIAHVGYGVPASAWHGDGREGLGGWADAGGGGGSGGALAECVGLLSGIGHGLDGGGIFFYITFIAASKSLL